MIRLNQCPTFDATVNITVLGKAEPVATTFGFRALNRKRLMSLLRLTRVTPASWLHLALDYLWLYWRAKKIASVVDMLDEIIESWEGFDEPYSRRALGMLIAEFPNAHTSIFFAYLKNHSKAREKN